MSKGKGQNLRGSSDKGQKYRTFKNKTAQRARHQARQPNDRTVSHAKRWSSKPADKKP